MAGANAKKTPPANEPSEEGHDPATGEVQEGTAVGAANSGAVVQLTDDELYTADVGEGFENQTGEDVAVPFLVILQPGSKEVLAEGSEAKAGQIINKSTGELIKAPAALTFIPAITEHLLVEWIPRDNGGGYVGSHALDSKLAADVRATQSLGTYKHPSNGNDLVETFYVYGVALDPAGAGYPAVIAFASTHIKAYKDWMFRARSIVIPLADGRKLTKVALFSHAYSLRTARQDKAGNTWYTPVIGFAGKDAADSRLSPTSELYNMAKAMKDAVGSGRLKADTAQLEPDATDAAPRRGSTAAEEAPY